METLVDNLPHTVEQLIPDEVQMHLMAIGQSWRSQRWEIGDLVDALRCHIEKNSLPIATMMVYIKVSALLGNEVSPRTVRYWADVSAFYPERTRVKYSEVSHYHFGIAKSYASYSDYALGLVSTYVQEHGSGPGEGWLEMRMSEILQRRLNVDDTTLPDLPEDTGVPIGIDWQDLPMAEPPRRSVRPLLTALHDIGVGLAGWLHGRKLKKANRLLNELEQILSEIDLGGAK